MPGFAGMTEKQRSWALPLQFGRGLHFPHEFLDRLLGGERVREMLGDAADDRGARNHSGRAGLQSGTHMLRFGNAEAEDRRRRTQSGKRFEQWAVIEAETL